MWIVNLLMGAAIGGTVSRMVALRRVDVWRRSFWRIGQAGNQDSGADRP